MDWNILNTYEKDQICVLSDKFLIRHTQWDALAPLQHFPVLWIDVDEASKSHIVYDPEF